VDPFARRDWNSTIRDSLTVASASTAVTHPATIIFMSWRSRGVVRTEHTTPNGCTFLDFPGEALVHGGHTAVSLPSVGSTHFDDCH